MAIQFGALRPWWAVRTALSRSLRLLKNECPSGKHIGNADMIISDIRTHLLSVPFADPPKTGFLTLGDIDLLVVEVETASGFGVLERETLFALGSDYFVVDGADFYDIAPDDQRFLMARLASGLGGSGDDRFILVTNWFEELLERVPN